MSIGFVSSDPLNNLTDVYDRPIYINADRAPTTNDVQPAGTFWQDANAGSPLIYQTSGKGVWVLASAATSDIMTLTGDSGGALSPTANNINLLGTVDQITTTGSGSTITWSLPATLIAPGTVEVTGLLTGDAGITISGGAVAIDSGTNAFGLSTDASNTTVSIASGAAAKLVTLGSTNGASSLALQCGTGNMTIQGVAASTITIGKSDQSGAITIANSTGALTTALLNGVAASAQVLNVASGSSITGTQTVNLLSGATPGATTTLNIMGGIGSAGNQVIAALGAAISQGTNSASFFGGIATGGTNTFNVFAGAFTGGTNSINLFSGAFTTVAATFNLFSGASTSIGTANIGTGTSAAHVTNIGSNAGGNVTIISGATGTIGIGLGGNAGQLITIGAADQTGAITIANSTGALTAALLNGVAASAQVLNIASGTSSTAAQTINILNGTTPGASTTLNVMNGAASAGTQTVAILSTGATRAGAYSIGNGNAAHVGIIGSTTASASLTLQAGSGATGLKLSAAGNVQMVPVTGSSASSPITITGRVVQATFTGFTTASGSTEVFELTNSTITGTTQAILVSVDNLGSNDAQMTITRVLQAASSLKVSCKNNGAAALNGDVHITVWVLN